MRISDWSSDVCSSDLITSMIPVESRLASSEFSIEARIPVTTMVPSSLSASPASCASAGALPTRMARPVAAEQSSRVLAEKRSSLILTSPFETHSVRHRSEEHTSELQSLMRISYAVFCLKKKTKHKQQHPHKVHTT